MSDQIPNAFGTSGPGPVRAVDIFPELSDELDRRIAHSEQRIKSWVIAGILANLMVAIMAAIPAIFYMGQISRDINQAMSQLKDNTTVLNDRGKWMNDRMIWEAETRMRLDRIDHGGDDQRDNRR